MKKNWIQIKLWFLIAAKYTNRNKSIIVTSLLILVSIIFAQYRFKLFVNPNAISIGLIGTFQEHDLPIEVTRLLSSGLVEADENGRIHAKLVTGWETNNDATNFRFKLKDNLKWVDNTPIKAGDLAVTIPDIETKAIDDKTIQLNLKDSYSPLPSLLTKPIFKNGTLIGTGPYKITRIEKSRIFITKIILKSSDDNLPEISIRFYPTEKVAITGFNLGEVQVILGINNTRAFDNNPKTALIQSTDFSKIVTVLFQVKDPQLANRSLRQALAYASPKIDNEQITDNPYPAKLWAYNPDSKKYLSNLDEAKEALQRAKASMNEESLKKDIILTTIPNLEEVGNKVVSSWKELGLNARLRIESGIAQNFQALLITQSIPIDPDQYFLWHATQTKTNLSKYDSKRVDKDLEDGRKIISEEDRKAKYFDFQKTLLEDAPAVFLYFPKYNIVYQKKTQWNLDKILNN